MFSDYPEEKVVLLIPCSSFKILSIDDFYYATKSKNHLCRKIYMEYIRSNIIEINLSPLPSDHKIF